jgi:starch phosphorylase
VPGPFFVPDSTPEPIPDSVYLRREIGILAPFPALRCSSTFVRVDSPEERVSTIQDNRHAMTLDFHAPGRLHLADMSNRKERADVSRSSGASPSRGARLRERLERLTMNLWWTWSADANALWDAVADVFPSSRRDALRRNPVLLVRKLSERQLSTLAANRSLGARLKSVEQAFRSATRQRPAPFGLSTSSPVAYFSMEFGLHETLPVYAGGLGILAGDHIKSASDVAVPLVGVSFLYRQGYFRQLLDSRGKHEVIYPRADFGSMPLEVVHERDGSELRISVELPGREVWARVWRLAVGRRSLYLLDTDIDENSRKDRGITSRLYTVNREERITQEVVLGIGGVRVLRALGVKPGVWHYNEGHIAFLSLERMRELREKRGLDADAALEAVAADTVFTTHTPVPEGNEAFDLPLAERFLRPYCEAAGIPVEDYLRLGVDKNADGQLIFSLTVLAMRVSRLRNGVSALHGEVSREMWSKLWPGFDAAESPITSVTNGIHVSTWVAPSLGSLYAEYLGDDWEERCADSSMWKAAKKIPDRKLWDTKRALKGELVEFVRERTRQRLERYGWSEARCRAATENLLDPDALTIGFARRFALYKRAGLLFRDLQRAVKIFGSTKRPVQIIVAGKPHPEDALGTKLFEEVGRLARNSGLAGRVVLLENYDTEVARHMVRGVDVWLNSPRRPQEASGTSGQKVPVNLGLNLSILDGWWCEGADDDTGWSFGKEKDYESHEQQDRDDHADLMRVLDREVLRTYYDRDSRGLPRQWLRMLKASLQKLVPQFSTHRMVLEYAERLYAPALENGRLIRERGYALAKELAAWRHEVEGCWPLVHVRGVAPSARTTRSIDVDAYLGGLSPETITFCDETGDLLEVEDVSILPDGAHRFCVEKPASGRCARMLPTHPALVHVQELGLSLSFEI